MNLKKYKIKDNGWEKYIHNFIENNDQTVQINILDVFVKQLIMDEMSLSNKNKISDCSIYIPRNKTTINKKYKFSKRIALTIYPIKNIDRFDLEKTNSYILFSKLLSKLTRAYCAQRDEEIFLEKSLEKNTIPKIFRRKDFCELKKKPVSDAIKEPTAMPVEVAPLEELNEFFEYLKKNEYDMDQEYIKFQRGICYRDGRMDLCKQVVGPDHIRKLMDSLVNNTHIKHFLLGNNIIGLEGAKSIAEFLKLRKGFATWYLAGNDLNEDAIKLICNELVNDTVCTALWLKRNPIKNGIIHLSQMLETNNNIKILDLHNTGLLDNGIGILMSSLKKNNSLRNIYLDANGLTDKSAEYIADYFQFLVANKRKGITSLWIDINRLDDTGITTILRNLKDYPHLKRLNIGSNRITAIGMKEVYECLKNHPCLFYLDLGCYKSTYHMGELPNDIQDDGSIYITNLIKENKMIRFLDISFNGISINGIKNIADAVEQNDQLMFFNYKQFNVCFPDEMVKRIKNKLLDNRKAANFDPTNKNFRSMKHWTGINYIDSLYRNKM